MKKHVFRSSVALAAFLSLGIFAFAQHDHAGGAGMGGGPPMGGGPGGDQGGFGRPADAGAPGMGRSDAGMNHASAGTSNIGSHSPGSVLNNNPKLDSSLSNALGKSGISIPGGNLQTACAGFKNLGSCIAALHVAKNLGLNFDQLRSMMTGPKAEKLGKAIHGLGRPNVTSKREAKSQVKKANKQAKQDLRAAASTSPAIGS
ncbi:MAG: hypothetical protein ACLGRW_09330 [Acidobacteriota bacterium]